MLDDLWRSLQTAIAEPEAAELAPLWQALETALAPLSKEAQLRVAAEAITQITKVYAARAEAILSTLDGEPILTEPILGADFLSGLVKQSTSLNLDALVEEAPAERRSRISHPIDSVAGVIDKQALLDALDAMQPLPMAHVENVGDWSKAIANYLQQHPVTSLVDAQHSLKMPLIELWIGALLSSQVKLEQRGNFYQADSVWLVQQ
jgi:thymidine phosphorylase